ncbi:FTR1 family protein [Colwellia sp. 6M3]|nr:FTR1 family protein [Colwellia sp. 6M3]
MVYLSINLFSLPVSAQTNDTAQLRQLAQLAEYIGVDYADAVENGEVVNAGEYQEMLEFSAMIIDRVSSQVGSDHKVAIYSQSVALEQAIKNKMSVSEIRLISAGIRGLLLAILPESPLPSRLLPEKDTQTLFQENCVSCHGVMGKGDGLLAKGLSPEPTNFTDKERAVNRSLLGLFDAISNGLDDTAMPAFTQLKEQQRWSLAFYVGGLAFNSSKPSTKTAQEIDLQNWINFNPTQLINADNNIDADYIDAYRASPSLLFNQQQNPIEITKSQLSAAIDAYKSNEFTKANTLAVSAYLDGFELIENSLDARDEVLRKQIEVNLINLRQVINSPGEEKQLMQLSAEIFTQLDEAERLLTGAALSSGALFSASLVILLREGLEALLVVIALMTVLIRTNRRDALKYVHAGWVLALIAGVATWAVAQSIIDISGASREMMEGVAALLAAIMLLYVGIWMHSKTNAEQWQAYIQKHISTQLRAGTLWGLTLLAFIAVYREVFETVLFYQSLLTQASPEQYSVAVSGFITGVVLLAIVAWAILKYSIKLPIARFFSMTTYLLLALAFILMGKAITALQEAAVISISALPVHVDLPWIGVGSTWQGAFAQIAVILFFAFYRISTKQKPIKSN